MAVLSTIQHPSLSTTQLLGDITTSFVSYILSSFSAETASRSSPSRLLPPSWPFYPPSLPSTPLTSTSWKPDRSSKASPSPLLSSRLFNPLEDPTKLHCTRYLGLNCLSVQVWAKDSGRYGPYRLRSSLALWRRGKQDQALICCSNGKVPVINHQDCGVNGHGQDLPQ